eukprot:GHVU01024470.1.p2 GENE.GHVU01024470.1~~GHVU01024470.1.p2  ORF type:complete len:117 (-),score=14.18 GHVU01024470.1:817-1167(-)
MNEQTHKYMNACVWMHNEIVSICLAFLSLLLRRSKGRLHNTRDLLYLGHAISPDLGPSKVQTRFQQLQVSAPARPPHNGLNKRRHRGGGIGRMDLAGKLVSEGKEINGINVEREKW